MRAINRKLVEAEANEDGAAVRDDRLTSLETKLLNMGSELVSYGKIPTSCGTIIVVGSVNCCTVPLPFV